MDNTHSAPIKTEEYPNLVESITKPETLPDIAPENTIDPPPSIHHLVTEKTFLSKELGIDRDNEKTRAVNAFILSKLKEEGLKDTKEGYTQVLKSILSGSELTLKHEGKAILEHIYNKFTSKEMTARDWMLFVNVLIGRETKDAWK